MKDWSLFFLLLSTLQSWQPHRFITSQRAEGKHIAHHCQPRPRSQCEPPAVAEHGCSARPAGYKSGAGHDAEVLAWIWSLLFFICFLLQARLFMMKVFFFFFFPRTRGIGALLREKRSEYTDKLSRSSHIYCQQHNQHYVWEKKKREMPSRAVNRPIRSLTKQISQKQTVLRRSE